MEHHSSLPFLSEALLFLTLAGILIPLLQRFRINQIVGFLIIGVVVGPHGLTQWVDRWPWLETLTFTRQQEVASLAELGVIFLMFLIGLELSVERMWGMRRWVFAAGSAQILGCSLVIAGLAYAFGNSGAIAVVLGLVLSLSSTAVVIQLLTQQRAMTSPVGQAAFAILMMQDLAVVPLLILVELMAQGDSAGLAGLVALTILKSVAAVLLIFVGGRRIVAPIFRLFARQRQPEVFMALTLLVTLGIAGATAAAGLSMALGAFLAGLLLAETEYRHEVEVTIEPFKGLLMGLFFMTVGMGIDVTEVVNNFAWVCASVLGLMLVKACITTSILRLGKLSWGRSLEGGILLSQGGEFAFIIVGFAAATGLMENTVAQFMLLVVSLTLVLTPVAAKLGNLAGIHLDRNRSGQPDNLKEMVTEHHGGHVILAGCGRVGQLLASVLGRQEITYIGIEHDAALVYSLRNQGLPIFYGDAARPELLRKLHAEDAAALIVTMDQPGAAMHTVRAARALYPELPIYARSRDEQHAHELKDAGATGVVPETLEAGLQLSAFTLSTLGIRESDIVLLLEEERERRVANT